MPAGGRGGRQSRGQDSLIRLHVCMDYSYVGLCGMKLVFEVMDLITPM